MLDGESLLGELSLGCGGWRRLSGANVGGRSDREAPSGRLLRRLSSIQINHWDEDFPVWVSLCVTEI